MHLAEKLVLLIICLVFFSLGAHTLSDPDIGWHLAGGLYILDNFDVPRTDPLGAQESFWWAYSWLAELLFAKAFDFGSWTGLLFLQGFLVLVLGFEVISLLRNSDADISTPRQVTAIFIACLFVAALTAPVHHLRPQLISLIFFCVLLKWLDNGPRLSLKLMALTLLWANVHVYWLLAPACLGLWHFASSRKLFTAALSSTVLFLVGLITPYGPDVQLHGIYTYLFEHKVGYSLIKEFASLGLEHGFIAFLLFAAISYSAFKLKAREHWPAMSWIVLCAVLIIAGICRVKFLPLAAVAFAPILVKAVRLNDAQHKERDVFEEGELRKGQGVLLGTLILVFCGFIISNVFSIEPLEKRSKDLLKAAEYVSNNFSPDENSQVLADFNDAGWLELGFWLFKPAKLKESKFKLVVDGRTLVVGQKRLEQYRNLLYQSESRTEIINSWNVDLAILPRNSAFAKQIAAESQLKLRKGLGSFEVLFKVPSGNILGR